MKKLLLVVALLSGCANMTAFDPVQYNEFAQIASAANKLNDDCVNAERAHLVLVEFADIQYRASSLVQSTKYRGAKSLSMSAEHINNMATEFITNYKDKQAFGAYCSIKSKIILIEADDTLKLLGRK